MSIRAVPGECLQTYDAHDLVHFGTALAQQAAGDETGLNIAADGQPREQVVVLEHQAALGAGMGDQFAPHAHFAGRWLVESRDHAQDRRFAAAALSHERDHFARRDGERNAVYGEHRSAVGRDEALADVAYEQRRGLVAAVRTCRVALCAAISH
jgi:hypothetical protein